MKALILADRKPGIIFKDVVAEHAVNLVITLGDLERHDLMGLEQVTSVPKIGVYGNHCSGNYMEEFGIMNMHLMMWKYNDLVFGGFQGCVRYKENPDAIMYTQQEASAMLVDFPSVDVFLCHCPPRGINDEEEIAHQGFDGLRTYIDKLPPKLLLHGHTYPTDDTVVTQHGPTRIEYVSKYKIIEF